MQNVVGKDFCMQSVDNDGRDVDIPYDIGS